MANGITLSHLICECYLLTVPKPHWESLRVLFKPLDKPAKLSDQRNARDRQQYGGELNPPACTGSQELLVCRITQPVP
jgi:hypothetical protein